MLFSWDLLIAGFADALSWSNLAWALVGCLIGTLIGVLPGIGPSAGIAILLPVTTMIPPTSGIIMMAAIYYGAMYGGSTTAIVVNIPGEASSVPTAIDGYEMAKQGRGGAALGISAISSFVSGTLGLVGLTFFAPLLANVALAFGPPEYFALMFMGLSLVISLSGRALLKGLIAMSLGLLAALIGQNPLTGASRLTFGWMELMAGINFISVIIGLFAISEVMINAEQAAAHIYGLKFKGWMPKPTGAFRPPWNLGPQMPRAFRSAGDSNSVSTPKVRRRNACSARKPSMRLARWARVTSPSPSAQASMAWRRSVSRTRSTL